MVIRDQFIFDVIIVTVLGTISHAPVRLQPSLRTKHCVRSDHSNNLPLLPSSLWAF